MFFPHLLPPGIASYSLVFLGIQWGSSPEQVHRRMLSRSGVQEDDSISGTTLGFSGGSYAGMNHVRYQFGFVDGGLRQAIVYFLHTDPGTSRTAYNRLRRYLGSRYGWLGPEQKLAGGELASHHCSTASGRVTTGLSRLENGYLVSAVITGMLYTGEQ